MGQRLSAALADGPVILYCRDEELVKRVIQDVGAAGKPIKVDTLSSDQLRSLSAK
jgi:hypothetical protein